MFETYHQIFQTRWDDYHAAMMRWPQARRAEFAAVLDLIEVAAGDTLLDMPSGGGYLRDYVPDGVRYIALETSKVFHACCLKRGNVEAVLGDLQATCLPSQSLDQVVSLAGMHHVDNRGQVYAEVQRILRPGGRYLLVDASVNSPVAGFLNGFVHENNS